MKANLSIWIPRGLAILTAAFMLLMSMDSFEGNTGVGTKIIGFLMHNIPFLIVVLIIWLTWKRPLVAGVIFIALALVYILAVVMPRGRLDWIVVALFPFVTGAMYVNAHFSEKKLRHR